MKRITSLLILIILCSTMAGAQAWQGIVRHNGYACLSLGPVTNNDHKVLVGKGTDAGGHEVLHIKFKSPYRWKDTGTAHVRLIRIDLNSGRRQTHESFCNYDDGWIYLGHYTYDNRPCFSYIITVYKDNDFGKSKAGSRTFNLHLDKLDLTRLPMSNKPFETYW